MIANCANLQNIKVFLSYYLSKDNADVELSLWITLCVRHILISRASTTTEKQHGCPRSIPGSFSAGGIAVGSKG